MSYIGATPTSTAFLTDSFSGDGSTTSFTLSAAPASSSSILVAVSGVLQDPATYAVVGTALNFTGAPPAGTANISVRYLGVPASNISTAAYRTVTEFTATAGQTSFSTPSYTVGFINVYRNGVLLGSADYTATTGTTVVLASGATAGDLITTESFYVSSIYNAISNTAGSVNANNIADGAVGTAELADAGVTAAKLASGAALSNLGTAQLADANMPSGSIIQVVQAVKTDTFTSSANLTWTDITGMTATITPSSTSSKIMVEINMFGVFWTMGYNGCILRLLKNGTNVGGGDAASNRSSCIGTQAFGNASKPDAGMMYSYKWIDSPSSTSALTYKIQFYQDTPANPIYVNRTITDADNALWPRTLSTITLTEIVG